MSDWRGARRSGRWWAVACAISLLTGCDLPRISPDRTATGYPTIGVHMFAETGEVSPEDAESNVPIQDEQTPVWTTTNTKLQLFFRAEDKSAGIAKLSVRLAPGVRGANEYVATGAADAQGNVPQRVVLIGHAPDIGMRGATIGPGNVPFELTITAPRTIQVFATNFAGKTKEFDVNFFPLPPVYAHIELSPPTIDAGGKSLLYEDWHGATDVIITPTTQLLAGGAYVSPSATTTYTMTARQPFAGPKVAYPNANGIGETLYPTVVTSTATLTVKQPAGNPTSGSGSIVTTQLNLVPRPPYSGWVPYVLTWPAAGTGSSGATLVKIANPNMFDVRLLKVGYDSSKCGTSAATVPLAFNQATTPQDDTALFYQQTLPLTFIACIEKGPSIPPYILLNITYKNP